MSEVVLDASAVLAVIFDEPGSDQVAPHLPGARISTVNIAEVATRLLSLGMPSDTLHTVIETLQLTVDPFDYDQAIASAELRESTRAAGLSFGDRACLGLARSLQLPALTSDTAWQDIAECIGVSVVLIR